MVKIINTYVEYMFYVKIGAQRGDIKIGAQTGDIKINLKE